MKDGNTTLSVPIEFADELRQEFEGRNDLERLENWKSQGTNEEETSYNEDITLDVDDIRTVIRSELENLEIDKRTGEVSLR